MELGMSIHDSVNKILEEYNKWYWDIKDPIEPYEFKQPIYDFYFILGEDTEIFFKSLILENLNNYDLLRKYLFGLSVLGNTDFNNDLEMTTLQIVESILFDKDYPGYVRVTAFFTIVSCGFGKCIIDKVQYLQNIVLKVQEFNRNNEFELDEEGLTLIHSRCENELRVYNWYLKVPNHLEKGVVIISESLISDILSSKIMQELGYSKEDYDYLYYSIALSLYDYQLEDVPVLSKLLGVPYQLEGGCLLWTSRFGSLALELIWKVTPGDEFTIELTKIEIGSYPKKE
jgi:hypothetical protein